MRWFVMLPDFFGRRIVHLLDCFARQMIAVLIAHEIEYLRRLIVTVSFAILYH